MLAYEQPAFPVDILNIAPPAPRSRSEIEMGKVFVGGLARETTTEGLRGYFERFGDISDCVVMKDRSTGLPRGFGFVTYASQMVADRVVHHRHVVDGKEVEAKPAVPRDSEMLARPGGGMGGMGGLGGMGDHAAQGGQTKGVRKYTCRFVIGIENDKEFQVARRVIGAKGANMKRIVQKTEAKLRLRGLGSGYFEGAGQKESSEPLQLCISCTEGDHYKAAVRQVEELLKRVYEEYRAFCRENGMQVPDLQINFSENQLVYSASRSAGGAPPTAFNAMNDFADDGSPKKERRARRTRAKGSHANSPGDDDDRGEPGPNAPPPDEIEKMIDMRNEARRACNFAEADRVREALHSNGVALMDEPGGRGRGDEVTTWRYWRD